jgi:hypothetical protein
VSAVRSAVAEYVTRRWRVLPLHSLKASGVDLVCSCGRADCSSPGKHPRLQHGVLDASSDPLAVAEWWQRWPDANVGIATGAASGIYVVDLDGPAAIEAWRALGIAEGWASRTGNGMHLVYSIAEPLASTHWRLGQGIDTRGDGGYIVAPPSLHYSGRRYAWEHRNGDGYPPGMPDPLREALTPRRDTPPGAPRVTRGASTTYGEGVLRHALERVHAAPDGARNSTLNDEAFLLGQFVAGGELEPHGIADALLAASTDPDKRKARATISRGLHDGGSYPRSKPT